MAQETKMKAGKLLILDEGEYSDRSSLGPFRVLKDFDVAEAIMHTKAGFKPQYDWQEADPSALVKWLHENGYIEDVDCQWCHVGGYGRLEL
jgi:hypothetical protein